MSIMCPQQTLPITVSPLRPRKYSNRGKRPLYRPWPTHIFTMVCHKSSYILWLQHLIDNAMAKIKSFSKTCVLIISHLLLWNRWFCKKRAIYPPRHLIIKRLYENRATHLQCAYLYLTCCCLLIQNNSFFHQLSFKDFSF